MSTTWRYTDNPSDPCCYCVSWTRHGNPVNVWGRREPRIWNGVHDDCAQSVALYVSERPDD